MSNFVLKNVRSFAGGVDLTSVNNKFELSGEVEEKETTNYGSNGWKEVIGGLGSAKITGEGQWEAGDASKVDDSRWAALGTVKEITVCPDGATVGSVAWILSALETKYALGGTVGDVAPWSIDGSSSSHLVRGQIMHPPGTARTSSGNGTTAQLGALTTGHTLYANFHVLSVTADSGTPTITFTVQSDNATGFPSATTQATSSAFTAIGSQSATVAAPVTDDWWRVGYTIAGGATNPGFLFVVAFGIGLA
ncbi:MAG TPA: hypothetical protein VHA75_15860 [Rugosimonospora sp.]|nr:hypothetical protein [Rugosimonospora sp.]